MRDCFTSLRALRLENGWSIDDVAWLTGYSPAMLSRVERGQRQFSPKAKVHVARCLGVQVADLFPAPDPPAGESDAA